MADANQDYFDAAIRRQIGVRRYTAEQVSAMLALLEKSDRELVEKLRRRLGKIVAREGGVDFTSARLRDMLKEIREVRQEVITAARAQFRGGLLQFARDEADFERKLLELVIPVEISVAGALADTLRAVVTQQPFYGRLLNEWFDSLAQADQRAIVDAIQLGLAQGEDVDAIVRRVVGTRANRYSDGVLAMTRRNAEAVVRTAINHVSNGSREEIWAANEDIILALRWTSVLDGRTSAICRSRDGHLIRIGDKPLPPGSTPLQPQDARPPAHVSCRSIIVAVLDASGIAGTRPFVVENGVEIDLREQAKKDGISLSEARDRWSQRVIGTVPAATTYQEWLGRQSKTFQEDVLGVKKAKLFRTGKIKLDQFVDRAGKELTLDQLRQKFPDVFRAAKI